MKTKTIMLHGYEVTGMEEFIIDIEKSFKAYAKRNNDFSWENLYENDTIYCWNGETAHHVTIDHKNKKVLINDKIG